MKALLIILVVIYVAIGLGYWSNHLRIMQMRKEDMPEYSLFTRIFGSIVLMIVWVVGWPVIKYIVEKYY